MKTHSGDTGMIWYDRVRFKTNKDTMFKRCLLQVLLASLPAQGWVWNWLPWPKGPGLPTKTHSLRSQSSETYSAQTRRPGAVLVVADWWGTRVTRTRGWYISMQISSSLATLQTFLPEPSDWKWVQLSASLMWPLRTWIWRASLVRQCPTATRSMGTQCTVPGRAPKRLNPPCEWRKEYWNPISTDRGRP